MPLKLSSTSWYLLATLQAYYRFRLFKSWTTLSIRWITTRQIARFVLLIFSPWMTINNYLVDSIIQPSNNLDQLPILTVKLQFCPNSPIVHTKYHIKILAKKCDISAEISKEITEWHENLNKSTKICLCTNFISMRLRWYWNENSFS